MLLGQGRKRNPNPNFLAWISSGGVGGLRREGVGGQKCGIFSRPRETKLFGGISLDFCRDILRTPEKFEKKMFVFNSRPLLRVPNLHQEERHKDMRDCPPWLVCREHKRSLHSSLVPDWT